MTSDLIESDLQSILRAAGSDGDYVSEDLVKTYNEIISRVDQEERIEKRSSREERKEAWKKAMAKLDRHQMASANRTFQGYIRLVRRNAPITTVDEPARLTETEARDLMEEALELTKAEELLKARRELLKARFFGALNSQFAEEGDEYPEHTPGSIEVTELGHRFVREGGGRKDPELDEESLRKLLGDALWRKVSVETIIPAQVVRKVDHQALLKEARKDPSILDSLRKSLKVGQWKTSRFVVRPITDKE